MAQSKGLIFKLFDQHLELLPQKALLWHEESLLVVADVHFGKVGHFRKAGIAIPRLLEQEDLAVLSDVIEGYRPETLVFLGDLFHSEMNSDWYWFRLWRELFPDLKIILVLGNHDILKEEYYRNENFEICEKLKRGPFVFTHAPITYPLTAEEAPYLISGHIHPGVKLKGKGRQNLRLPCFCFGEKQALLPAFGKFTGKFFMNYEKEDKIFGILDCKVIPLSV